jgi:hypothetical protein
MNTSTGTQRRLCSALLQAAWRRRRRGANERSSLRLSSSPKEVEATRQVRQRLLPSGTSSENHCFLRTRADLPALGDLEPRDRPVAEAAFPCKPKACWQCAENAFNSGRVSVRFVSRT